MAKTTRIATNKNTGERYVLDRIDSTRGIAHVFKGVESFKRNRRGRISWTYEKAIKVKADFLTWEDAELTVELLEELWLETMARKQAAGQNIRITRTRAGNLRAVDLDAQAEAAEQTRLFNEALAKAAPDLLNALRHLRNAR